MTTISITKNNTQDVFNLILERLNQGNLLIDLYDDHDFWVLNYETLSPLQKKRYDDVDLVDKSLYTDA